MENVRYEPMLVTYIDILGFEGLVKTKTAGEISRILRLFNEATAPPKFKHDIPDMPIQEHVSFSDLNMTCTPLHKRGNRGIVFQQFLRLVHAQTTLLIDDGVLIHGGIAVGLATKSYRKFFGPAVIQAYRLERKKPGLPRILVDPSLLLEVQRNPLVWMHDRDDELKACESFLAHDANGDAYIDYLRMVAGEIEDYDWVLREHKALIAQRMVRYAKDKDIRAKYEWLRDYHAKTVRSFNRRIRKQGKS